MKKCLSFLILSLLITCCSQPNDREAHGYIEGRYTYIATSVSGILKELLVTKGATVKKGQKLFSLELEPESDIYKSSEENLKQSMASREATIANLEYAKLTYERYKLLVPKNAIQQSQLDNAKSVYNAYVAQLSQADSNIAAMYATLAQTSWSLDQKVRYAPVDGFVYDTYYRIGRTGRAGKSGIAISFVSPVDAHHLKRIENYLNLKIMRAVVEGLEANGKNNAPSKNKKRRSRKKLANSSNDRKPISFRQKGNDRQINKKKKIRSSKKVSNY